MEGRVGYEFKHYFFVDEEIVPLYHFELSRQLRTFLFEFRTDFILKERDEDGIIIDTERYDASIKENKDESHLEILASYRLKEYWMDDEEVQEIINEAHMFATEKAGLTEYLGRHVIPIVVHIEVLTVQQDGEPIETTMGRQITATKLVPLYLWPFPTGLEHEHPMDSRLRNYLRELPRERVTVDMLPEPEQDDELLCILCGEEVMTLGSQITRLICQHVYHSYCAVELLETSHVCMECNVEEHNFPIADI